jgi:hypothetical protein
VGNIEAGREGDFALKHYGLRAIAGNVEGTVKRAAIGASLVIGLAFMTNISLAGPAGTLHYPDLQTLPPSDVGIEYDPTTGRRLLRFSNTIVNLGDGPLELIPTNNAATAKTDAYQRLYSHDDNGKWQVANTVYVGTFVLHPQHNHWHFEDFARYELRDAAPDGSLGSTVIASSDKVSFCLTDIGLFDSSLEHAGKETYIPCDATDPQGISVGWADVYAWDLYGQSLDITGLPEGDYWLVSTADPDNVLDEGGGAAENNNTGAFKVHLGSDLLWVDDAVPVGAITAATRDSWIWVSSNPTPHSGALTHQSAIEAGLHQHFFYAASATLSVSTGNVLFAYVYLDPSNPPSEVMLEWSDCFSCQHRAYWGADRINYGANGTASRRYMGPLPSAGQWVRLEVPASLVELEGVVLQGMSFTLFDGRATWDDAGVHAGPDNPAQTDATPPTVAMTAPADNATASGVIVIGAGASDNVGVAGVQFEVDGDIFGPEITLPPFRASWNSFLTTNGPHTLGAVARDAAGNKAAAIPVTVVVSNTVAGSMIWVDGLTSGASEFRFRVFGAPGGQYVVEASADLLTWAVLSTNLIPTAGYFEFSESQAGTFPRRFYRACSPATGPLNFPRRRGR